MENETPNFDMLFKFIVIGDTGAALDAGVGKSCAVQQFIEQAVSSEHEPTIGVEFAAKTLTIKKKTVKLQIWDTAGQENFRSITRSYYRSAIGALLIFDVTRRDTFDHIQDWLGEVSDNGNADMQILLVGNKTDLHEARVVLPEEAQALADQYGLAYLEMSTHHYDQVEHAFMGLALAICEKILNGGIDEHTPGVKIVQKPPSVLVLQPHKHPFHKYCCQ